MQKKKFKLKQKAEQRRDDNLRRGGGGFDEAAVVKKGWAGWEENKGEGKESAFKDE